MSDEQPSAASVASWIVEALSVDGTIYQDVIASEIADRFGESFITINSNGNRALTPAVLRAFNKLTGDAVVWSRSARLWRQREEFDLPGRLQP